MREPRLIILNPCSGIKKANKYLTQIVDVFTHAGYMSTVLTTTQRGDGILYAGKYGGKYDLITCIGGDGTFNEVVAGLMKKGHHTPLGYIPAGSTNDFATSLNLSTDIVKAAKDIVRGEKIALDIGSASTVAIASTMAPILIGAVAVALFRKPVHWLMGLGACAAATGLVLLGFDSCVMQEMPLAVIGWSLGAAAGFALYSMLLRAAGDLPPLLMLRKSMGYGLLGAFPFYYTEFKTEAFLLTDPVVLGNLLFLSVGALAICWALWICISKTTSLFPKPQRNFLFMRIHCVTAWIR